jgi:hypothetical protein
MEANNVDIHEVLDTIRQAERECKAIIESDRHIASDRSYAGYLLSTLDQRQQLGRNEFYKRAVYALAELAKLAQENGDDDSDEDISDEDEDEYTCPLCATTFSSEEKLDDHRCMISTPKPAPLIPQIGTWVLTSQDELLCVASLDTKKQTFKTVNGKARPLSSIKAFIQHEGI